MDIIKPDSLMWPTFDPPLYAPNGTMQACRLHHGEMLVATVIEYRHPSKPFSYLAQKIDQGEYTAVGTFETAVEAMDAILEALDPILVMSLGIPNWCWGLVRPMPVYERQNNSMWMYRSRGNP